MKLQTHSHCNTLQCTEVHCFSATIHCFTTKCMYTSTPVHCNENALQWNYNALPLRTAMKMYCSKLLHYSTVLQCFTAPLHICTHTEHCDETALLQCSTTVHCYKYTAPLQIHSHCSHIVMKLHFSTIKLQCSAQNVRSIHWLKLVHFSKPWFAL